MCGGVVRLWQSGGVVWWWSGEAHFQLNGFVNKQNFSYWKMENTRILNEKELHPKRETVSCAIMCDCIIGPYFFENEEGYTKTVNG